MNVASPRPAAVVIMAAGLGTRMKSSTPKVLHPIGGRSLVMHAVTAAISTHPEHLVVVVGSGRELVEEHLNEQVSRLGAEDVHFCTAVQEQQRGTGDAVRSGLAALPDDLDGVVLVTSGDVPLLETPTLLSLLATHTAERNAVTLVSTHAKDPTGYGRVVRDTDGSVTQIVEHRDADDAIRALNEINAGIYAFDAQLLRAGLSELTTDNDQGELYLTDLATIARGAGQRVGAYIVDDSLQVEGVNDRVQLATLGAELNRRRCDELMRAGVTIVDPHTTWIDSDVQIGQDTTIRPHTQLLGATVIGSGAVIGPEVTMTDCEVGDGASVVRAQAELAIIGPSATVGPYSFLRPGTKLAEKAKVGGFVETKNAQLGVGAKVPHLTYCGDAVIGDGANIGAGTIFANYDGVNKSVTKIGKASFVGSNSVLVAPVEIADGSYVAAGSAITDATNPGDLAVARSRQRNVAGWVARKREGTASAQAAAAAQADKDASQ